ncbi:hypothetical protein [Tenacibaculum finnmarkense]|uniref:Uncharacterized protein n=1 Tax=Tenacibaculum finnmarkense genomovar finnmarkense TaxID=1458503 RepID=A0AAP1RF18_9FLAO|nr:hypothetical protein [Tenacibaculum finnmarkense]MBE7652454.1 hypothetical protein [Tenacibaculum finnmarkense genomovar finnmarkense]MBE7660494.1 hypothetical protein [Tenacibaculum finnmarkense genomovar finnmarkense]MBE7694736.1 hypothetical protein [Tenacibaculum finnmarkense genomovar finnmarkense]MCD8427076.1 hypothetical protein [Tenacibaculum finnmarkense genomovar finnmarkense]MCG8252181.1 hypothetical protein [Tenacibaculum finnmarkense genomovar finnmarkense]
MKNKGELFEAFSRFPHSLLAKKSQRAQTIATIGARHFTLFLKQYTTAYICYIKNLKPLQKTKKTSQPTKRISFKITCLFFVVFSLFFHKSNYF